MSVFIPLRSTTNMPLLINLSSKSEIMEEERSSSMESKETKASLSLSEMTEEKRSVYLSSAVS